MTMKNRELLLRVTIKDCDVQTFRAGGKGGQNQNKRSTGVRIIHRASGAVGESREHREQLQNKRAAFRRMAESAVFQNWVHAQVGEKDLPETTNPERIRTYNFIDRWVKDHRTGVTCHNFDAILNGDLDRLYEL